MSTRNNLFSCITQSVSPDVISTPRGRHVEFSEKQRLVAGRAATGPGRTWLTTLDKIRTYYASNPQLTGVQLVTWNDYEEATEIETGIDNCVRVTAKRAGNMVVWQIEGSEDTIDHYTLWSSNDGNTFARIRDVKAGVHSADLSSADIPQAGGVKIYVQAVGRASLTNHISDPVAF